jgi:hypothetical protein
MDSYDLYNWGKTNVFSLIETSEEINIQYYNYGIIDVSNFYYWVETNNVEGCVTRSYWNAPVIANDLLNSNAETFQIFPNPVQHTLNLQGSNIKEIKVFDSIGNLITKMPRTTSIDVSAWSNGFYFLQITTDNKMITYKFLKI